MDQNEHTAKVVITDNGISLRQRCRKKDLMTDNSISPQQRDSKCNLVVRAIIHLLTKNHLNIILVIKNQVIALRIVRFSDF